MINLPIMKKKLLLILKISGIFAVYSFAFVLSVYFTMQILIKTDEIQAPDFRGKSLKSAFKEAKEKGIYLKKSFGLYDKTYKPLTVIDQFPSPDTKIKVGSVVKVYVSSDINEVIVPQLVGLKLNEVEDILKKSNLRKGFVSYIFANDVPIDFVIFQSYPEGLRIPEGSNVDILVSKGLRRRNYVMPDLIGKKASDVVAYFENNGLKIVNIKEVDYFGLEPGIIIRQSPAPGFKINSRNRISIEVSR